MTSTALTHGPARRALNAREPATNRTILLAMVLVTQLMIVLDVTVVITSLPQIHRALSFSPTGLSWVQNAYTLTFGGLLLLGARAGDIVGRRRAFIGGVTLFTVASLLGGLAQSAQWLIAARSIQGVGAAVAAPATLALLTSAFREGRERNRAIGYYSAVSGGGGSVGLVLGGMLTAWVSWRFGLFVNVPIGATLIVLALRHLPETEPRRSGHFDVAGALTATGGATAIVYGFVRAADAGWSDTVTRCSFLAGVILLAAFVVAERRAAQPITPLRLFTHRTRAGAYATRVLLVGAVFSMFFFVGQFLQVDLGYSALQAGIAFLPQTLVLFAVSQLAPRLATRFAPERLLVGGLAVAFLGMTWLSRIHDGSDYFPGVALPLVALGVGIGLAFVPLTAASLSGVSPEDAGAASGLVNVSQQLGASLGLGVLVTVYSAAAHGAGPVQLAHGVGAALTGAAVLLACALVVAVASVRKGTPPPALAAQAEAA